MKKIELLNNYKPLFAPPNNRYYLFTGGRGSAKSFHISYFLLWLSYQPGHVILFTRWTLTSAQISIIPEFTEKIDIIGSESDFIIKSDEIINKHSGSVILFKGIKTSQGTATANLKSISGVTTWVLDEAEELVDEDVFDKIDLSIRSKNLPNRVILIMNPSYKTHFIYKRFIQSMNQDVKHVHTTYLDNIKNLSDSFIDQANTTKKENYPRYEHLFLGKWLEEQEGILWNKHIINRVYTDSVPLLKRKVIAIDPSTTKTMDSDETGITVQGLDKDGNGYLLDDLSGKYSPNEWALEVVKAAEKHSVDCIVAEKNQGGDMVETVIRQYDKKTRIKLVHATKGKQTRAEPIYGLYEQGKIYHYGKFPTLESQMLTFNPNVNKESPDRVDALVWGFTELMINFKGDSKIMFTKPVRRIR